MAAPKFGTSGLRGLVTELTPELIAGYVQAFAAACPTGGMMYIGRDLRPSSPRIAANVAEAARQIGLQVVDCGEVPTPALALASMQAGGAAVMVTGSHIPADRNGLKFYIPTGEISKADEAAILAKLGASSAIAPGPAPISDAQAGARYVRRYSDAFGADALAGLRVGVYSHSAVGRDLLIAALRDLGADVEELARSDTFIPVDTEAVDAETRALLQKWSSGFDAIVSTDGDGDRPLVADGAGNVVPGDILGQITAALVGAQTVVTPVSSNTGAEALFGDVIRTRIGSPYVIAGMQGQLRAAGYEANGGFLLGFDAAMPSGPLGALMTRDCLLPIIAALASCKGRGLAATVAAQPARFTAADRLTEVPVERSQALVARLATDRDARAEFLGALDGIEAAVNETDGLRITLANGRIVHIRPSGNAPELRFYAEAETPAAANALLADGLVAIQGRLGH